MSLTARKTFRLSEENEIFLTEQCQRYGMNDSEYIRYLLNEKQNPTGKVMRTQEEFLAIKELTDEINHIGININQIVRNVNMQKYSDHEKRKLFALMEEIRQKVARL